MLQFEINLHYRSPFWFRHLRETNFPDGAMKRFLSSAAPSSSGRAEPPSSSSSAEQPAIPSESSELSVIDARKMLGEELPTTTAEKSALKQKVWTLLRFGFGCTFKHAAHAEYISSSSKCANALRAFPSRREAACYLKAGADVLEGATTTEINKLLHASSGIDKS